MGKKRSLVALGLVCACVAVLAVDYASRPMVASELQQQQAPNWIRQGSMNGKAVYVAQPVLPPFEGGPVPSRGALWGANLPDARQAALEETEDSAVHAGEGAEEAAVQEGEGEQGEVSEEEKAEEEEVAQDEREERMEADERQGESETDENAAVREGEVADQTEYDAEEGDDAALGEADGEIEEEPADKFDLKSFFQQRGPDERPIDSYYWRKVAFGEHVLALTWFPWFSSVDVDLCRAVLEERTAPDRGRQPRVPNHPTHLSARARRSLNPVGGGGGYLLQAPTHFLCWKPNCS